MRAYARAEDEIKEELFPKETPRDPLGSQNVQAKEVCRELKLPRRRWRREPHKFADIAMQKKKKHTYFARTHFSSI